MNELFKFIGWFTFITILCLVAAFLLMNYWNWSIVLLFPCVNALTYKGAVGLIGLFWLLTTAKYVWKAF